MASSWISIAISLTCIALSLLMLSRRFRGTNVAIVVCTTAFFVALANIAASAMGVYG